MSKLGWQILKRVREDEEFYYIKDLIQEQSGDECYHILALLCGKCHTPIRTNVFKNVGTIRVYNVGKDNHPGDRSDVYNDNRHSDDNADDEVLGACSDTYIKGITQCPNRMLDDEM